MSGMNPSRALPPSRVILGSMAGESAYADVSGKSARTVPVKHDFTETGVGAALTLATLPIQTLTLVPQSLGADERTKGSNCPYDCTWASVFRMVVNQTGATGNDYRIQWYDVATTTWIDACQTFTTAGVTANEECYYSDWIDIGPALTSAGDVRLRLYNINLSITTDTGFAAIQFSAAYAGIANTVDV